MCRPAGFVTAATERGAVFTVRSNIGDPDIGEEKRPGLVYIIIPFIGSICKKKTPGRWDLGIAIVSCQPSD